MELYVALTGRSDAPGTKDSPFISIQNAKEKIRALIAKGLSEAVTVHISEGNYSVPSLLFDMSDSGTAESTITYVADGNVVLNGGVKLDPDIFEHVSGKARECLHEDAKDKVLCTDLTKLGISLDVIGKMCVIGSHNSGFLYDDAIMSPMWCELFINDTRQTVARYPNDEFLNHCGAISEGEGLESKTGVGIAHDKWIKMRNPRSDVYKIDEDTAKRAASWKYAHDLWMFGYPSHDWADMSTPVVKIDPTDCSMETKYVSMFGVQPPNKKDEFHNGGRYYLYNLLDEIDAPGEWYIDRNDGMLYIYPPCDLKSADINLSLISEPVLNFDGASNLTFRGFTVTGTRSDGIAGRCSDITIESCLIKNVSGHAVSIEGYRNIVKSCEISETGRGGIHLKGGDRETLTRGENIAENNYIHDFSKIYQTYQSGIHLYGVGNIARHNEICNTTHMALGYNGNEHLIEYNYIHDAVSDSSDAGAIYSGFDWAAHGTVIRYNRIENIGKKPFRPDGIYWDDGLSGQTAYGNVLINIPKFAFHIGGGRENTVERNIIIKSGSAALKYDDRHREGYLRNGWARKATEYPNGKHWRVLSTAPIRSEIWTSKYPTLAGLKTDPASTDPNDPEFPINPAHSSVQKNAVIAPFGDMYNIVGSVYTYSSVSDNYQYSSLESLLWDEKIGSFAHESEIYKDIPELVNIPLSKIGRYS